MIDPQPRWEKDDAILASQLNRQSEGIDRANSLQVVEGSGLTITNTMDSQIIGQKKRLECWAKITGGGTAGKYSATQQIETSSGGWTNGNRTWTSGGYYLREANAQTTVPVNSIVRAAFEGAYWVFDWGMC